MENQVFSVDHDTWKRAMLANNTLYLTSKKPQDFEEFKRIINDPILKENAGGVPLEDVFHIKRYTDDEHVFFKFNNSAGKEIEESVDFGSTETASAVADIMGSKANLSKSEKSEGKIMPLLWNIFYVLLAGGFTFLFGVLWDGDDVSSGGSRKSRGGKAILRLAYEYIGQTGILVIGCLITLYTIYGLIKGLRNPKSIVTYER